ncbi:MAG: hypothetical protein KC457_09530 [Myxococcales bacterium]|nr:hypothetical protein [Myxococcales bacterium]
MTEATRSRPSKTSAEGQAGAGGSPAGHQRQLLPAFGLLLALHEEHGARDQRDDADSRFNKGVGQLRVEGDLVVVRDGAEVPSDRSREAPSNARLELSGVVDGTRWKLVARQTMNDLEVELQGRANTGTAPQASLESPTVAAGSSAKVTVAASDAAMRYLLEDGAGKVLVSAVGTGAELILDSGALEAGTRLWLVAQPVAEDPIIVDRAVELAVTVA